MKKYFLLKGFITRISILIIFSVFASATSISAQKTTMSDVKRELSEALEVIKNYSAERQTEVLAAMKKTLDTMDQQIARLRDNITKQWEEMEPEARKKAEETLRQLQRQRNKTAEAVEEARKSGKRTWNDLKENFMKNYEQFKNEFEDVDQEYDDGLTYL